MAAPAIYVLNRALERIGVVSEFASLVWTSRAWDHSEAQLFCPIGAVPAEAAFLMRSDTDEAMLITRNHVVSSGDDEYAEVCARGATLLLARRVNWWTKTWTSTNLAVAAGALVADAQATYLGIDRTIAGMSTTLVDETVSAYLVTKQVSWGSVAQAVYDLVRAAAFTFGVRYDGSILRPFVRRGADLSAAVVFAREYADVISAELDVDTTEAANLAVVGGQGEGAARVVTTLSIPDGEELSELWVDADDLRQGELTAEQYLDVLEQRGAEKLAECPVTTSIEGRATQDRYRYRTDYDLGDTVSFRTFGLTVTDIISEVTETIERGQVRVDIALGKTAPTIRRLTGR